MADITSLTAEFNEAYQQGQYPRAAELGGLLAVEYERAGNAAAAAEARNNQSVAFLKAGQSKEAYAAAEGTDQVFAAAGDVRRQALALGNQAAALEGMHKLDQAAALYQQSAQYLEEISDKGMHAIVMKALTAIYLKQGKQMDSVIALQASLAGENKQLSPRERFLKGLLKRVLSFLH